MAATKNKSELEVKILEVQQWLASLSGDLKNEPYEIDEFTVEYLYQLCQVFKFITHLAGNCLLTINFRIFFLSNQSKKVS